MKKTSLRLILCLLLTCMIAFAGCSGEQKKPKPSPDQALQMLKDGNERFLSGKSEHPHLDKKRMMQSSLEDQGDHAYATILASSDSRVPVEAIFDAGIMDTFVIRVPGNVCNTDQVTAIEYGLDQVRTPVIVVLGNTQCAAVTAVTRAVNGQGDIPPMLANIEPAVKKAMEKYPQAKGDQIIPLAIEENIYISIRDLFMKSPATCELVNAGKIKVVGAIYDVSDGRVYWLEDETVDSILQKVEGKVDDTQVSDAPATSDEAAAEDQEAAPEVDEAVPQAHEEAVETDEVAPDAHDDAAKTLAPSEADETIAEPEAHDTEVSDEAAPESHDAHEVAPEAHEAAPDASAPPEAEETPAEHETHDTKSHT
ncbi:carbonic anhydrase [uncultured Desulfobacter sp.]|uniref:carbonic anhydrase n=1 Tax=uncultured Desulfobacter sp. TaxID=240139 RepID=UPI0029F588C5|nr:carbonic anhydrase [uncultured Desulfobacter sp.]